MVETGEEEEEEEEEEGQTTKHADDWEHTATDSSCSFGNGITNYTTTYYNELSW